MSKCDKRGRSRNRMIKEEARVKRAVAREVMNKKHTRGVHKKTSKKHKSQISVRLMMRKAV